MTEQHPIFWAEDAYAALLRYVKYLAKDGRDFTAEDVRACCQGITVDEPRDRRAWGHIMLRGARDGIIRKSGYREHKDPSRHNGISITWKVAHKNTPQRARKAQERREGDQSPRYGLILD